MAVIQRTECLIQGIVKYLLILVLISIEINCIPSSCDSIRENLIGKGYNNLNNGDWILNRPTIGPICTTLQCCSQELQEKMQIDSQIKLEEFLKTQILDVSRTIDSRAKKFDELFRELMNISKREFHDMFERTYGKLYLQNAYLFSDFFNELDIYYRKGTIKLSDTLDQFFAILYQRMFTVINSQYQFNDQYLDCVSDHMIQMKPFGDVPNKLSVQLRRSFVATKTFYKSLIKSTTILRNFLNIKLNKNCHDELTRMQSCNDCDGTNRPSCSNYCTKTLEMCLKNYLEFSPVWDTFVGAIEKVAERLLGPYNIEVVVEPLNIKISEAIMNFQEARTEISNQIYNLCGKPKLIRTKRKTSYNEDDNKNVELKYETLKNNRPNKKKNKKIENKANVDSTPTLDKLIVDIKTKVKDTKQFLLQLPYQYCNNPKISAQPNDFNCWNGTSIGEFKKEFDIKSFRSDSVAEQIYQLQSLTEKLRQAYQGQEVEFSDDSDDNLAGSGSASGCGEDDEDCNIDTDMNNNNKPQENDNKERNNNKDSHPSVDEEEDDDLVLTNNENVDKIDERPTTKVSYETSTDMPSSAEPVQRSNMSLTRALVHFVVPIVLCWFGGAINDLL